MKEDIFLKVGYSPYLQKEEKRNWTSNLIEKIIEHKIVIFILAIILVCLAMNFWLVYKFMSILENSVIV